MDTRQIEAIGAICAMAALADGSTSSTERERIEGIFKGLSDSAGDEARALATAYRRVAVCDADGRHSDAEGRFLETLRAALGLSGADAATVLEQADELAEIDLTAPVAATAAATVGAGAVAAAALPRTAPVPPPDARNVSAEVDSSILKYSILNGALELLPQSWASMAIIPLQVRMVYKIGQAHGVNLDQGSIKEFIATVGVGMTSQVVEGFARDLLGGLAKKFLGKTAGKVVKTATGAAMSFATTYALGQVAKQYYAGGRKLSSVDLRALFAREVERAKGLYAQHRPQIEQSAKTLDPRQVLSMVRGA